jgi:anhydro-N-acetylmuramic acid kinase
MIIDEVVSSGTEGKKRYDPEGSIAAAGRADAALVDALMEDPYFSRRPPKSTGREVYGAKFARTLVRDAAAKGLSFEDTVATGRRLYRGIHSPGVPRLHTAPDARLQSPYRGRRGAQRDPAADDPPAAGSGHPGFAVRGFRRSGPGAEAMAFALLGHESLLGRPGNLPAVTGARAPVVLGSITLCIGISIRC